MSGLTTWLSGFTKGTRSLLPFARSAVSSGIRATEFYNVTKAAGIGARKTDVLRMMSDLKKTYTDINMYLDQSNLKSKPIPDLIPPSLGRSPRTYTYVVKADRVDELTGFTYESYTTIASSTLLETGDVYAEALDDFNKYGLPEPINAETLWIDSITRSDNPIFRT